MIDLSKLDPYLIYELERQMRAAFGGSMYVSIGLDFESEIFTLSVYENQPEWHGVCYGNDKSLVDALRKCGEFLAAAEEKMEVSNG